MKCLLASVLAVAIATPSIAQISFDNVESRTGYGTVEEGDKGVLTIDTETISFDDRGHAFTIPTSSITELYYSRVSGRRIKSAIFISPILFLSKGLKNSGYPRKRSGEYWGHSAGAGLLFYARCCN